MITSLYVWYSDHANPAYRACVYRANGKGRMREISAHRAYSLALLANRLVKQHKVRLYPFCSDGCVGWSASRIDKSYMY